MKNKNGVLMRPSERKPEIKRPVFLVGLLSIILIVNYIFILKNYEPVENLLIQGGILVYPFTFLVLAYISKYYGFKEAKKSVFISAALFVIFIVLMMICVMPEGNNQTSGYNAVIQYLYTNEFTMLGNTKFCYPILGQFFGLLIAYIISHLLYATIYNAIHNYTVDYLAVGLSGFIAYVIDRIVFMPILFLENLFDGTNTFDYFIKCLTSEFIGAIFASVLIIILYVIIVNIKDNVIKRKHQLKRI